MTVRVVALSELLDLSDSGIWGDENPADGVSVLRSTNFKADGSLDFSKLTFREIEPSKRESKLLRSGDILLEKSGGGPTQPVGRVCLFRGDERPHSFGNFIARLRPNDSILPEFLFYFLWRFHASGMTNQYQKQTTGIRNLEFKRYLTLEVPVPTLEKQRLLVDLLSRAEGIVRLRREAQCKAAELIPALFLDMFGDPASNLKGWSMLRIDEIVERFEGGKNMQAGDDESAAHRILKISAVTSGRYIEAESKPAPGNLVPAESHFVRAGDLLISRANTEALVGATAIVERTDGKTLLPDKLWRFVWRSDVAIEPHYALHLLQQPAIRAKLSQLASGTGGSMKNISQAKLKELKLPVPPIVLQHHFATKAEAVRSIAAQQAAALATAQATFDALLHQSFAR